MLRIIEDWHYRFAWWRYNRLVRKTMREDMAWALGRRADRPAALPPPPAVPGLRRAGGLPREAQPDSGPAEPLTLEMARAYVAANQRDPQSTHRDLMRAALESQLVSGTDEAIGRVLEQCGDDMVELVSFVARMQNRNGVADLARELDELELDVYAGNDGSRRRVEEIRQVLLSIRVGIRDDLERNLPRNAPRP